MGLDLFEGSAASKNIFQAADTALGFKLTDIIFSGPEDKLKLTYYTQPALLTTSLAFFEAFKQCGITPNYVAGHSLGEYSALVAAGALSFLDAVKIVYFRGQFMDQAVPAGKGSMAAVLGMEREVLVQFCRKISIDVGLVEIANINCPGQIVISGSIEGIRAAVEQGKAAGAKRVIPLEVSGPFHSSLMKPAADKLRSELSTISLKPAAIPVVANVTARAVSDPQDIHRLLVEQVYSPVLWEDSISWMIDKGVDTFFEIGPGTVLAGLIKKINRDVKVISINSLSTINEFDLR